MDKPFQSQPNGPLRKSLFTNIPPYLNYLPNGKDDEEVGACQEHTETMVDLRECLWRVPVAFTSMVAQVRISFKSFKPAKKRKYH